MLDGSNIMDDPFHTWTTTPNSNVMLLLSLSQAICSREAIGMKVGNLSKEFENNPLTHDHIQQVRQHVRFKHYYVNILLH